METIRENFREFGKQQRQKQRENVLRHHRSWLGTQDSDELISVEEVKQLAEQIKQKRCVNENILKKIKKALIQNEENINAFMSVDGSLSSLVREISGHNSTLQLEAAFCVCNLALGDSKLCYHVAKAAVPYLILHLDTLNYQLLDVCLYTIGNLAGSGVKSWSVLHAQGILTKLIELLSSSEHRIQQSCIYALTHFIKSGANELSESELITVARSAHVLLEREPSCCWLIFLLSCSPGCVITFLQLSVVCRTFSLLTCELNESESKQSIFKITAYVRILGNLTGEISGAGAMQFLELCKDEIEITITVIQKLLHFSVPHVKKEAVWFINNLCSSNLSECDPGILQLQDRLRATITV